jgi:uncharacterized protein
MSGLFVDTSGWAAILDKSQPQHALAVTFYRLARLQNRLLVTTNYILTELVALFDSPLHIPRDTVIEYVEGLRVAPSIEVVHIDPTLDAQAWQLLKSRPDKRWSLVDCASFVVMQQRRLTEALTTDRHFEQAGFMRLIKPR